MVTKLQAMSDFDSTSGSWIVGAPLSPGQEAQVAQFKSLASSEEFAHAFQEELIDDPFIAAKFLNAKNWKLKEAIKMAGESYSFRTGDFDTEGLLNWRPPDRFLRYVPGGVYGEDRQGNPVAWMLSGRADLRSIYRLGSKKDHKRFRMWQMTQLVRTIRLTASAKKKYVGQATLIFDLDGIEWSRVYMPMIKIFNECNKIAQGVYPELLKRIIIINPPMVFSALFALAKPFLYKRVIDKIVVAQRGNPHESLLEHICDEYIPKMFGGTAPDPDTSADAYLAYVDRVMDERQQASSEREFITKGPSTKSGTPWSWTQIISNGHIPVTMGGAVPDECFEDMAFDLDGAVTVSVGAGKKHTIAKSVGEHQIGSTLTWEFMSKDKDCGFELAVKATSGTKVILPNERVDCNIVPESGAHSCAIAGEYMITFDNSYSWMSSKTVQYKVALVESEEPSK